MNGSRQYYILLLILIKGVMKELELHNLTLFCKHLNVSGISVFKGIRFSLLCKIQEGEKDGDFDRALFKW